MTSITLSSLHPSPAALRAAFPLDAGAFLATLAHGPGAIMTGRGAELASGDVYAFALPARGEHAFLATLRLALALHAPLVLAPHHLWLLIQQACGAAREHSCDEDPESAGSDDDGGDHCCGVAAAAPPPPRVSVRRGPGVPPLAQQLAAQLASHTLAAPRNRSAMTSAEVVACSLAGRAVGSFSRVILEGSARDWAELSINAAAAVHANCCHAQRWAAALLPVLTRLAAHAAADLGPWEQEAIFWASCYTTAGDGWVHAFFPFLANGRRNARCRPWQQVAGCARPPRLAGSLPTGRDRTAVRLVEHDGGDDAANDDRARPGMLETGFLGLGLTPDGHVRPEVCWVLRTL